MSAASVAIGGLGRASEVDLIRSRHQSHSRVVRPYQHPWVVVHVAEFAEFAESFVSRPYLAPRDAAVATA